MLTRKKISAVAFLLFYDFFFREGGFALALFRRSVVGGRVDRVGGGGRELRESLTS
jgi:hypothetical protein